MNKKYLLPRYLPLLFSVCFLVGARSIAHAQHVPTEVEVLVVPGGAMGDGVAALLPQGKNGGLAPAPGNLAAPHALWRRVGDIQFLPNAVKEVDDGKASAFETSAQAIYDNHFDVMRFVKTVTPQQLKRLAQQDGSLPLAEMGAEQKAVVISLLDKYESHLRTPAGENLVDIAQSAQGQKGIHVLLSFNLSLYFYSKALEKGYDGRTFVKLPVAQPNAQLLPTFATPEEAAKLSEALQKPKIAPEAMNAASNSVFSEADEHKLIPLQAIVPVGARSVRTKPIEEWLGAVRKYTGTPFGLDSRLKGRMVSIVFAPQSEVEMGGLLTALGQATHDSAQWKLVDGSYTLTLKSRDARYRQNITAPARQLYASTVETVYTQFPDEMAKMGLPQQLFLESRRSFESLPSEAQNLMYSFIKTLPESGNKRLLLDPASNREMQVEFAAVPVIVFLYGDEKHPPTRTQFLIKSSLHGFPLRLESTTPQAR